MNNILIIGAGRIGQAIASQLKENTCNEISFWDINPDLCTDGKELNVLAETAEFIFCGAPANAARKVAVSIAGVIKPGAIVVSLSKGLEAETGKSMDQVWLESLPETAVLAILSGPMLATELKGGKYGWATIAAGNLESYQKITSLFQGSKLTLSYSNDLRGTALMGVLKNIYALFLGLAFGLGAGYNTYGALAALSTEEIRWLMNRLGGKAETFNTPGGLGDYLATAFSSESSNHTNGVELATEGKLGRPAEGIQALPYLLHEVKKEERPKLLSTIARIFQEEKDPRQEFADLLAT